MNEIEQTQMVKILDSLQRMQLILVELAGAANHLSMGIDYMLKDEADLLGTDDENLEQWMRESDRDEDYRDDK